MGRVRIPGTWPSSKGAGDVQGPQRQCQVDRRRGPRWPGPRRPSPGMARSGSRRQEPTHGPDRSGDRTGEVPRDAHTLTLSNNLAWALATCLDRGLQKSARAVALAMAVPAPGTASGHAGSGCPRRRLGRRHAALSDRSTPPAATATIRLAMACWKRGQREQARIWLDRAERWMEKKPPQQFEVERLAPEAVALGGPRNSPPSTIGPEPEPARPGDPGPSKP